MTQSEEHARPIARRDVEWLISPDLPSGVRLQLSSILDSERLNPEVLQLLAKFMK